MLPRDYISRIPSPKDAVEDPGLQYPWQTPMHWAYPAGIALGPRNKNLGHLTREDFGTSVYRIPILADEECLRRSNIPWQPKKKNKTYIKVPS